MKFLETNIPGVWIIDIARIGDDRGYFGRTFCRSEFREIGIDFECVQTNISHNDHRGTLRGMHYQAVPHEEPKLVSCTSGALYDVAVDIRESSSCFGKWTGVELSVENRKMLFIPKGFAHGFITLQDNTDVSYLMGESFHPESARGIRYDDPEIGIAWPMEPTTVSKQDRSLPGLRR